MKSVRVFGMIAALALTSSVARAELCDAGGCPANEYCAQADGGLETIDGGTCAPEPCIVTNDCPSGRFCVTSQEPHACVQCISTANCPGNKICDVATRTCVDPPEAGPPDAGVTDAGEDAAPPEDASVPDAEVPDSSQPPPPHDAAAAHDGSTTGTSPQADAGPDTGSLSGGACNVVAVGAGSAGVAFASAIFALGLVLVRRRRD